MCSGPRWERSRHKGEDRRAWRAGVPRAESAPRRVLATAPALASCRGALSQNTCPSEAATHGSRAPRASAGPGRASHRRGSAGAMPFPALGARQGGFPAPQGEPAPFYSRRRETSPSARLGPPPPCPTPGTQGAGRSPGTLAAPLCAQPSSPPLMALRPERARLARAGGRNRRGRRRAAAGRNVSSPRASPRSRPRRRSWGRGASCSPKSAPRALFPAELETVCCPPGRRGGSEFALPRAGRGFLWRSLGTRVLAGAGCAPPASPELQARLQREPRGHALPPLP